MNHSKIELREIANVYTRMARNLLAEKGSQNWSPVDQAKYDFYLDRIEAANDERERLDTQRHVLDIFVRKDIASMSNAEARVVRNAMSTTTGSQGGFVVPSLVVADVMLQVKDAAVMRRAATILPTATGADCPYPTSDGTGEVGEQLAQNAAATSLDATFGTASLAVYKYGSKVFAVPLELLQDMLADPGSLVMRKALERIWRIQSQKFTTGSGSSEPTGFVTAAAVGKTGTTGQTTTITYDDLVDLIESVDGGHSTLTWMMAQTMRKVVRKVKDTTTNRPVWIPAYEDTGASLGGSLLGYPVWINNDMAAPAANAKTLAFGNFKKYVIRDAMDMVLFRMEDSGFALKGQVGFLGLARAGGNLVDLGAIKLYQHSAT